jgi:hypothetical protein
MTAFYMHYGSLVVSVVALLAAIIIIIWRTARL